MNKYESVIIVNPSVDEEKLKNLENTIIELINKDGKFERLEERGKYRLAYQINKNKEGIFVVFYFEANPTLIAELQRNYRIIDEIMKFICIKQLD